MMVETRRAARKWLALPAATLTLVALAAPIRAQEAGKDTVVLADGTTQSGLIQSEDFGGLTLKGAGNKTVVYPWKDVRETTYRGQDEYNAAREAFVAGRYQDAEAAFAKLAAESKQKPLIRQQVLFHQAVLAETLGKPAEAATAWHDLMTEFPQGRYLGVAAESLVVAKLAAKDAAGAAAELAKIETATKDFADFRPSLGVLKGMVLEAQNKTADARAAYDAAAMAAGASVEVKATAALGKARCLMLDKKPEDAEPILRGIVTQDAPVRVLASAWNGLGDITMDAGRKAKDSDKLLDALFAYLRSSVQYLPLPGEPTREYERALAGSARCFAYLAELEQKPERKDQYNTRSRQRIEQLRREYPDSEFLSGL
jgi:tetratricopeptide (TPR) repeat protein